MGAGAVPPAGSVYAVFPKDKGYRAFEMLEKSSSLSNQVVVAALVSADMHEAQRGKFALELMAVRKKLRDRIAGQTPAHGEPLRHNSQLSSNARAVPQEQGPAAPRRVRVGGEKLHKRRFV